MSLLDLYLPAEIRDFLLPLACALLFLLTVIASILQARKREQREVAILVCGHVEKMQALADTGNLLRDPISGRPVCVVSENYKEKWKIPAERMRLIAYETVAGEADGSEICRQLSEGEIDVITFTSSSTVKNLVKILGEDAAELINSTRTAAIGPVTAATCREQGIRVDIEAKEYTIDGLVDGLVEALS